MRPLYLNTLIIVVLLFSSCSSKPVDVVIDRKTDDSSVAKIVIDGKTTLRFTGDSTTAIKLKPGSHFVQVNDSAKQNFVVGENGGILNLSDEEYVIYQITYATTEKSPYNINTNILGPRSAILVDSFLITPKTPMPLTNAMLRNMVNKLTTDKPDTIQFQSRLSTTGLKKIGKGQLFIDKTWDYNMTDSIPETIEIRSGKYSLTNSDTRTSILRSRTFLFALLFTEQDEYIVKSLRQIREGKTDAIDEEKIKEEDKGNKEAKSKQMKF